MLSKEKLEYSCRLSQSMDSLGPIENTGVSEDPITNDIDKNTLSWSDSDNSSYSNVRTKESCGWLLTNGKHGIPHNK